MAGTVVQHRTRLRTTLSVSTTSGGFYCIAYVDRRSDTPARPFHAYGHEGGEWRPLGAHKRKADAEAAAMSHAMIWANAIDIADAMRATRAEAA